MSSTSTDKVVRADNGQRNEMANALRALAMDAVQQANSGHPGAPMGMAEMAVALWHGHLRHNPGNPKWANGTVAGNNLRQPAMRRSKPRIIGPSFTVPPARVCAVRSCAR